MEDKAFIGSMVWFREEMERVIAQASRLPWTDHGKVNFIQTGMEAACNVVRQRAYENDQMRMRMEAQRVMGSGEQERLQ